MTQPWLRLDLPNLGTIMVRVGLLDGSQSIAAQWDSPVGWFTDSDGLASLPAVLVKD
jgi:hypothetical protein